MVGVRLQNASRPCLVYKVLAAGREVLSTRGIASAFKFALDHMKADDAMIDRPRFLTDDRDVVLRDEVVDLVDAAGDRILDHSRQSVLFYRFRSGC